MQDNRWKGNVGETGVAEEAGDGHSWARIRAHLGNVGVKGAVQTAENQNWWCHSDRQGPLKNVEGHPCPPVMKVQVSAAQSNAMKWGHWVENSKTKTNLIEHVLSSHFNSKKTIDSTKQGITQSIFLQWFYKFYPINIFSHSIMNKNPHHNLFCSPFSNLE